MTTTERTLIPLLVIALAAIVVLSRSHWELERKLNESYSREVEAWYDGFPLAVEED